MEKIMPNICQVCQTPLNLSRRELVVLAARIKESLRGRYFVPDSDVNAIIHKIHTERQESKV